MAIVFGSLFTINSHGPPEEGPWENPVQENGAFGVPGITFLAGAQTVRTIEIEIWIYNSYATEADLRTALAAIEAEQNNEATLTIDSQSYNRSRFDGLIPRRPRSRFYSRQFTSWTYLGTARFTQLQP